MHTDDVVYGTRSPSEPWHGGIAVAVGGNGELGGLNVTTLPLYDAGDADSIESKFWRPFERRAVSVGTSRRRRTSTTAGYPPVRCRRAR